MKLNYEYGNDMMEDELNLSEDMLQDALSQAVGEKTLQIKPTDQGQAKVETQTSKELWVQRLPKKQDEKDYVGDINMDPMMNTLDLDTLQKLMDDAPD